MSNISNQVGKGGERETREMCGKGEGEKRECERARGGGTVEKGREATREGRRWRKQEEAEEQEEAWIEGGEVCALTSNRTAKFIK